MRYFIFFAMILASPILVWADRQADLGQTRALLTPLAGQGNAQAQAMLGWMFESGHGGEVDLAEAIKWYGLAALQGMVRIQYELGNRYFYGLGVKQDKSAAEKWWRLSADAGHAPSQLRLGLLYYQDSGGDSASLEKAIDLLVAAAKQADRNAQYSLGVIHAFGEGRDRDYPRAQALFAEAAEQGMALAQFNLGVFYEYGLAGTRDRQQAEKWYGLAAAQGVGEALDRLPASRVIQKTVTDQGTTPAPTHGGQVDMTVNTDGPGPSSPELLDRTLWLRTQPKSYYTIQLASLFDRQKITVFIRQYSLSPAQAGYVKVRIADRVRYTAIYGLYESYAQAERAISYLPIPLHDTKPWIRNIGILQKYLQ